MGDSPEGEGVGRPAREMVDCMEKRGHARRVGMRWAGEEENSEEEKEAPH